MSEDLQQLVLDLIIGQCTIPCWKVSLCMDLIKKKKKIHKENVTNQQRYLDTHALLRNYQILDDFITQSIEQQTKQKRGRYHSNSIYDFIKLDNISELLRPFVNDNNEPITPEQFKAVYNNIRFKRHTVAHPCGGEGGIKTIQRAIDSNHQAG